MTTSSTAVLCILCPVVWVSGCSLFISTDGLGGNSIDNNNNTTTTPTIVEAGADGGPLATDATIVVDGNLPSGGRFCDQVKPAPFFCDDFDGTPAIAGWTAYGGATVDEAAPLSAPRSLLATTPAVANGASMGSALIRTIGLADRIKASWSMKQELATCGGANTGALSFVADGKYFTTQVQIQNNNASLGFQEYGEVGGPAYSNASPVASSIDATQWIRISMDVNLKAPGGAVVSVTVNDAVPPALASFKLNAPIVPTKIDFDIGLAYVGGPSGPCRARFDNVVIEKL